MNITKRVVGLLACAAVASGAVVSTVPAAQAASISTATPSTSGVFANSVWENGVNIRSGPGTGYTSVGQAQTGQTLWDDCYTTGTVINGNPYWDYVYDANTGKAGYVTEYYLNDGSQTLHC
jgi:uncharacterized protein YraI